LIAAVRCPGSLSQAPRPLPAGAVSIGILSWLRLLCQGPRCVPPAKFKAEHASMSLCAWIQVMLFLRAFVVLTWSGVYDARKFAMRPLKNAVRVRHCGQSGHNARTCPVLLAAAHPHAYFSKACSSAMHTTAESVGQQGIHVRTHRRACTHAHTHTHI
jgi:hypothetical protein